LLNAVVLSIPHIHHHHTHPPPPHTSTTHIHHTHPPPPHTSTTTTHTHPPPTVSSRGADHPTPNPPTHVCTTEASVLGPTPPRVVFVSFPPPPRPPRRVLPPPAAPLGIRPRTATRAPNAARLLCNFGTVWCSCQGGRCSTCPTHHPEKRERDKRGP
jgi:hypothetical protein